MTVVILAASVSANERHTESGKWPLRLLFMHGAGSQEEAEG